MKSSILLTSALAAGILALPQPHPRDSVVTKTRWFIETVTVTVTAPSVGSSSPPAFNGKERQVVAPFASASSSTSTPTRPTPARISPPFSKDPNAPKPPFYSSTTASQAVAPARISPPFSKDPNAPKPPFYSSPTVSQSVGPVRVTPTPIRQSFFSSSTLPLRASQTSIRPPFAAPPSSSQSVAASSRAASGSSTVRPSVTPPSRNNHPTGTAQAYLSAGADYQAAVLYHHNAARANHGAQPLTWDTTCEANARVAGQMCKFAHYLVPNSGEGQNLYATSGDAFNVTAGITESWYKSELPYMMGYYGDKDLPDDVFHKVGHFTQLVWKGTTKVGCVSIDCGDHMTVGSDTSSPINKFTVCNYAPAGNVGGRYDVNVQPPDSTTNLGSWTD